MAPSASGGTTRTAHVSLTVPAIWPPRSMPWGALEQQKPAAGGGAYAEALHGTGLRLWLGAASGARLFGAQSLLAVVWHHALVHRRGPLVVLLILISISWGHNLRHRAKANIPLAGTDQTLGTEAQLVFSTGVPPSGASTAARVVPSLAPWMCSSVVKISASHL
jgi:hypothetical protein